ncbi:MAG: integral rane protein [Acidimicrobiia bacterium]|nr:integral rane protein [Acidimicrobiia bacterium]
MIVGLVCALVAAVCYGLASVVQAQAVATSSAPVSGRGGAMVLARLVAQWRYVGGLALDLAGFAAALVALRTLPLFVVQAAIASSVGVTALAAHRWMRASLGRRDRWALAVLVGGLILLGAAGRPEHAAHLGEPGAIIVLATAAAIAVAAAVSIRSAAWAGPALAAGAGLAFGAVGVAARAFEVPDQWTSVFSDPLAYAVAVHGILGVTLFAAALQRATVTTVAAITFAVETVVPAAVGLVWLHDHARPGFLPVAVVGFVVTLGASIALSGYASPDPPG